MTGQVNLSEKVAVITGAASGIGKATANALAERGVKIVIGDIQEEAGKAAAQEINEKVGSNVAVFQKTDVTKYNDYKALFERAETEFGGVDIVFLNAGTGKGGFLSALKDLDDEKDEFLIDVNTVGVIKGTKVAILHLAKRGGGVIVTNGSTSSFNAEIDIASYSASKHAIIGWTRSFDLLPQIANIRVNAVCPGGVATNFGAALYTEMQGTPLVSYKDVYPMTKMETVVRAVLTCIEDESLKGETLLALPGDVVRPHPRPEIIPENLTPELIELHTSKADENIKYYKSLLKKSLDKYEASSSSA
ncbi:hypothetical protein BDA99DRAFT_526686 [Phascolomyces articulosus]|uniref:Uncharacterized protein n=1 Tax=Phascolomyces articulosus TaxID=60185 RepID=A0AAD5JN83_9FUNG|nr:hypothetical protein BDA99DRAFT_526686 [Phascolomyces articulosus]